MRNIAFFVLFCASAAGCGQSVDAPSLPQGTALWSRRLGEGSGQETVDIAVDRGGNTIVTGRYFGEVDFGSGAMASPANNYQAFLVKYGPGGAHVWSKTYGDFFSEAGTSVDTDASGNVYLAGYFGNTIDFGDGALTSHGASDMFLVKLDASGNPVWSQSFGSADNQRDVTLAVDAQGNSTLFGYAYGSYDGQIDFGGGPLDPTIYGALFIARFDASGQHVWSRMVSGDANAYMLTGAAVAVDSGGNAYLTGQYSGMVDFGNGPLHWGGDGDIFVVKLGPDGETVWDTSFGYDSADTSGEGLGIAVDPGGHVLVTGEVSGAIDFGGGVVPAHPAGNGYDKDPFVLKLDAAGNFVWIRRFGGTGYDHGRAIAADSDGNMFVTGDFDDAMVLAGKQITGAGAQDAFLLKIDAGGNPVWGRSFGNDSRQIGMSLGVDKDGAVSVGGATYGPIDLGDGLKPASGYYEAFVGKFAP